MEHKKFSGYVSKHTQTLRIDMISINGTSFIERNVHNLIIDMDCAEGRAGCHVWLEDRELAFFLERQAILTYDSHRDMWGQGAAFVSFCKLAGYEIDQTHS